MAAGIVPTIQTYDEKEAPALVEEEGGKFTPALNRIVPVPPYNSSEGWIGFNITLRKESALDYKAYGIVNATAAKSHINIVMHIVNTTGLEDLVFDGFIPEAWQRNKVYASAFLNDTQRADTFYLTNLDNCSKYIVLFRSYENDNLYTQVSLTIIESWYEGTPIVKATPQLYLVFLGTSVVGICLIILGLHSEKKKRRKYFRRQH
jgi:hypothetical protein